MAEMSVTLANIESAVLTPIRDGLLSIEVREGEREGTPTISGTTVEAKFNESGFKAIPGKDKRSEGSVTQCATSLRSKNKHKKYNTEAEKRKPKNLVVGVRLELTVLRVSCTA